jgi:hypothetical protein
MQQNIVSRDALHCRYLTTIMVRAITSIFFFLFVCLFANFWSNLCPRLSFFIGVDVVVVCRRLSFVARLSGVPGDWLRYKISFEFSLMISFLPDDFQSFFFFFFFFF